MTINSNTKIAALLKSNPDALEAIISISSKFEKLRNPILRKIMAGRTSIGTAAKFGGCAEEDFFNKLQPLGFVIERGTVGTEDPVEKKPLPEFIKNLQPGNIIDLDVRPVIETGKDPLCIIVEKVKALNEGQVLKIINTFEPVPLIHLLNKRGFESFVELINDELVNTYFHKRTNDTLKEEGKTNMNSEGWEELLIRFQDKLETIDVRQLEMPKPLHAILEALQHLKPENALFVYHKHIPVFLLPELEEQGFSYRIKELNNGEVNLLIYK